MILIATFFLLIAMYTLWHLLRWSQQVRWPYQPTTPHADLWSALAQKLWIYNALKVIQALAILSAINNPSKVWESWMLIVFVLMLVTTLILQHKIARQFHQIYPHIVITPGRLYRWMTLPQFPEALDQLQS